MIVMNELENYESYNLILEGAKCMQVSDVRSAGSRGLCAWDLRSGVDVRSR